MFDERRFNAQLVLKGMTKLELAEKLGMKESTLYRKIKRGGDFSRAEIEKMNEILDFDNPMDVFFAKELA